jgi:spermidine synthase
MSPWKLIDTAAIPGSPSELRLYQRAEDFSIQVDERELMNSRANESEAAFAVLGCERVAGRSRLRVLIGGLGLGFSLRAALDHLPGDAAVDVAELVPAVATWNRERLGHLAEHPLRDRRVQLLETDVARVLQDQRGRYDLVLLDVDNGPDELMRSDNDWLYGATGLAAARGALKSRGVLGIWSHAPSASFEDRLRAAGFQLEQVQLPAAHGCYGIEHTVWFAS